jgi:two-component system sensor kinase FixL
MFARANAGSAPADRAMSAAHLKKMYDRISELAKIGVWECDLATSELSWTDAVYGLFEIPRGAPLDRRQLVELYDEPSRTAMEQARANAIQSGDGFSLDARIRTAVGNHRWIRITAEIEQEDGRSVRIFGTKQDITAERITQDRVRSLQSQLIHVSRASAMDAMAATLAHEVNQPLASASNYVTAAFRLAKRGAVGPELLRSIGAAMELVTRAGETIRQLRERTRGGSVTRDAADLEPAVREAVSIATAGCSNVDVSYALASPARAAADPIQIQQVMINVIRNSCEASEGRACHIVIRTKQNETHLEFYVEDNGPGIPIDFLPRVFETHSTTKHEGLGMGLAIARTIIEAHGGRITVATRPEGGALVCFTLPLLPGDLPPNERPDLAPDRS